MKNKPRVLFFDIETSYIITREYKWGIWDERAIEQEIVQDWQILTIAWRWLGEKKIHCLGQDDFDDYKAGKINDLSLLKYFHKVIDEADIVVAHHGDPFDIKKLNTRMIINKIPPYSPTKQYDTKKAYKRVGAFTSNKLANLSKDTGGNPKGDPGGFKTWKGCVAGDPKAWSHMKKYNKLDIPPLEDIYHEITPWDKQSPALNIYNEDLDSCTNCLGTNIQKRGFASPTKTGRKRKYQCQDCFKWMYGRTTFKSDVMYTN